MTDGMEISGLQEKPQETREVTEAKEQLDRAAYEPAEESEKDSASEAGGKSGFGAGTGQAANHYSGVKMAQEEVKEETQRLDDAAVDSEAVVESVRDVQQSEKIEGEL